MKNLIVLKDKKEINDYISNLWKSNFFKDAQQGSHSYLSSWIKLFESAPRFFAETTDNQVERANFTPWFNLIMKRNYQNPVIHDLFYLHEIIHIVTLTYQEKDSWALWREKMFDNEMLASLETEVNIYQKMPQIRPYSFSQEIWADSILAAPKSMAELISLRKSTMINPVTEVEKQIANYAIKNEKWADIWKTNYLEVEKFMTYFYANKTNPTIIQEYIHWLEKHSTVSIPFKPEAELFAPIYWG